MCGIAGFIHLDSSRTASRQALSEMNEAIIHRGPDGGGEFVHQNVALGHRRLAIIDLESGNQPMESNDGTLQLVFNGEIYNYIELRKELSDFYAFQTDSDTEVILAAYHRWGSDCVKRFNGMWAFAIWDTSAQTLFCSRDRLGEKPFFYALTDESFVFGSEIKCIHAYGMPKKVNWEVLDVYLSFTHVPAPHTFFSGISKLPAGHSLTLSKGSVRVEQYWDVEFPAESSMYRNGPDVYEEFESLLDDAVRLRMRSDVPFGAFLSGGLDSATVVKLMSAQTEEQVRTFTIGFAEREYDERDLARTVAQAFNTNHIEQVVDVGDAEALMRKIAWHYDEPFGDASSLPTYLVSKLASEHVKMVLTGDGGDEVLAGYTSNQGEKFSSQYQRLPGIVGNSIVPSILDSAFNLSSGSVKRNILRAKRVIGSANESFIGRLESKRNGFSRGERHELISQTNCVRPAREFISDAIAPVNHLDNFSKLSYWQIKALQEGILCKVDRASMAHGLETRIPFLDYRIVDFMAKVHFTVKMPRYTRKDILLKTTAKSLPAELLSAKKKGFTTPLREWLREDKFSFLETRAFQATQCDHLNGAKIEKMISDHKTEKIDAGYALWNLAMFSYLLD